MSAIKYLDFDLLINRSETGYSVRVLHAPADADRAIGEFQLPFSDTEIENFLLKIGRPRRIVRRLESPQTDEAKRFGGRLFESVFSEEVRVCLRKSLEEASRQDAGLRVRLHMRGAPALADLPWEYLYDTSLNRFLALSSDTPLIRYLELPEAVRSLQVPPPLRVLVMISSPPGYPELDVEREWAKVNDALADVQALGLVVAERLEAATLTALQRKLRRGAYHIFHFIGHGAFDEAAQDGVLLLEGEDTGRGRPVTGQDLGVLLRDHRPLRLVILNACEGARASRTDPFAGTAQSMVQQGIPALIAMQFEISDDAAIAFSHEFYGALADGYPVDAALAEARKGIYAKATDLEWGTPVLYLRAPDGYIFNLTTAGQAGGLHGQVQEPLPAPVAPPPETPPVDEAGPARPKEVKPKQVRSRQPTPTTTRRSPEPAAPAVDVEALWTEALACFWVDNWARAVALLQEMVAYAPEHAAAAEKLAQARRQLALAEEYAQGKQAYDAGDWAAAVMHLEAVTGLDASYQDVPGLLAEAKRQQKLAECYEEAQRLFQARAWQAVVNIFEHIHSLDPAYPDPEGMLASAQATLASQERERRLTGVYRQAMRDMEAGRFAEAQRGFEQLAGESPGYKQTEALLARVRKILADRQAEAQRQQEAADFLARAQAALAGQDWDAAEAALKRAQELDRGRRPAAVELLASVKRGRELAAQYRQALAHLDAGRWDEAIAGFEQVAQADPGFGVAPDAAAADMAARSRQAKLEAEQRAKAERRQQAADLITQAQTAQAGQDWDAAEAALRRAGEVDPGQGQVIAGLLAEIGRQRELAAQCGQAQAHLDAGRWDEAIAGFEQVAQVDPGFSFGPGAAVSELLARSRQAKLEAEQRAEAERQAQAAAEARAAAKRAARLTQLYDAAAARLRAGEWAAALQQLDELQQLAPGYRDSATMAEQARATIARLGAEARRQQAADLVAQARAAQAEQDWDAAEAVLRGARELDPAQEQAIAGLLAEIGRQRELAAPFRQGLAHLNAGRWEEAVADFEQVVKVDPDFSLRPYATASDWLARSRQAGQEAEQQAAQEAEQRAAARLGGLYDAAVARLRAGEWAAALQRFDELQQAAAGYRDVEALIAQARRGQADEEARAQRQAALAESYRRAEAALTAGDWPRAAELLAQIEAAEPGYRDVGERLAAAQQQIDLAELFSQGVAHFAAGRWAQALQALREVTRLDPEYMDRDRGRAADLLLQAKRKKELAELPRPTAPRPGDKPKTLPR